MPIPEQVKFHQVVLRSLQYGGELTLKEVQNYVAAEFDLTAADKKYRTKGGNVVYAMRISSSLSLLKEAGFITSPRRSVYTILPSGRNVLNIELTPESFYKRAQEEAENIKNGLVYSPRATSCDVVEVTPEKQIFVAARRQREELSRNLLDAIMGIPSPEGNYFFEKLVTDLLVNMGYGEGQATQASNDRGIDGIIKTDPLGFNPVYIQAKRYAADNKVDRPTIQSFAGALGAVSRGAFITTSSFTPAAVEYARTYPHADIVLIDGARLTSLMITYNLGVSISETIQIKHIDTDYFMQAMGERE